MTYSKVLYLEVDLWLELATYKTANAIAESTTRLFEGKANCLHSEGHDLVDHDTA